MPQVTKDPALATGVRTPLCVLTSVSLAHHDKWLAQPDGEFAVVRLNFLADVSHVRQNLTHIDGATDNLQVGDKKKVPSPYGFLNVESTSTDLVTPQLAQSLQNAVLNRNTDGSEEARTALGEALKQAVVAHAWRPGTGAAASSTISVHRKSDAHKIRVRGGEGVKTVLFGERVVTLYLAYADYMVVTYKRKYFNRNLIRTKTPRFEERRTALVNTFDMGGFPFAAYRVLEAESVGPVPKKGEPVPAGAVDLAEIIAPPPADTTVRKDVEKKTASLYRVANAAFPVTAEMALRRDWTEEDLQSLPMGRDHVKVRANFPPR